jgi:hypothetical protein
MNAKLFLLGALLIGSAASGLLAGQPAQAATMACWSGYHPDRRGDCQPNNPTPDRYCPDGLVYQVFPNYEGYVCVPIPRGY